MNQLEFTERPELHRTIMVTAFAGWPDAAEGATRAIRHLVRQLSAPRFASIDPEEFYNFTEQRPTVRNDKDGERLLSWPKNEFFAWQNADGSGRDIVLFRGVEPHFKWRTYSSLMYEVAEACNVELVVTLGALLDAVPHTRPVKVTRSATSKDLGEGLGHLAFGPSEYQGPTGIMSVVLDGMNAAGIPCASYWGHSPHYVQAKPNPNVIKALLDAVSEIVPVEIDTSRLERRGGEFTRRLSRALEDQEEVTRYVAELEERWDKEFDNPGPSDMADGAAPLIAELEEFLRQQHAAGPGYASGSTGESGPSGDSDDDIDPADPEDGPEADEEGDTPGV